MAELSLNKQEKKNEGILVLTNDTVLNSEVSEEFSLPDYVPEIRRLLHVSRGVLPESRYISDVGADSELEIGGTVTYLVIYTDDEGKLCALPLTSAYEAKTALLAHPTEMQIDTVVDSVTPRVSAPRRLTVKSRLKSKIWGWEREFPKEKIEGKSAADELFIERALESAQSVSMSSFGLSDIKVSDKIDTQGYQNLKPLWCDAFVVIKDARVYSGGLSVRGDIRIKCVCESGEETVTLTKTVPLAEEISVDSASPGDFARIWARPVSLAISNEESGEGGQLFFDLACEIEGEVLRKNETELLRDCYSTKYETDAEYKPREIYSLAGVSYSPFTVNESVKIKNREINKIIHVMCDPVYEKTEFKGGKAITVGKLNVAVIGKTDSEYAVEEHELPFKVATDVGRTEGELIARCSLASSDASARIEGEKLLLSLEVCQSLEIVEKKKHLVLDSAVLQKDREIKRDAGCVRVYFPKEGDTLWEIAKKYHVTVESLKQQNSLSGAELQGVKNLII